MPRSNPSRLLIILAASIALPASPAAPLPNTIVVLGSSTAQGVGASSLQNSWVGLMTAALAGRGFTVQNSSIGGSNTYISLARFDRDVTPYQPGFVLLATSIFNETAATAPQDYLRNTLTLIRKVESIGAIPILVGPYPNNSFSPAMYSSIKDLYTILGAEGIPILDFLDGTDDGQGHWVQGLSPDGTHPTDIGHRLLFDSIPLTIFDALQRPMPPVNPHGFGSWIQNTAELTEGDVEIRPSSAIGSWTVSFWTAPSGNATERTLLSINSAWLQLRRTGSELRLWRGGVPLATAGLSETPAFHNVALTYQGITGTLSLYVDARLRAQTVIPGADPATVFSVGGDPAVPGRNASGDSFADVLLYRAPLAQSDIQAISTGYPPWKSVEAWLPLAFASARPAQNVAASTATVIVHGSWTWSNRDTSSSLRPSAPPRLTQ